MSPLSGRTARIRRLLAALLAVGVVLGLVLGPAAPASAHAELLASTPADGSVVAEAPTELVLQFTEDVSVRPDGVRVLDRNGARIDRGAASASGAVVTAPLQGTVPAGGYVVAWRALSADGHPIRGAFTYSVGTRTVVRPGLADEAFAASADRRDEVAGAVLRGLTYLAVLGVAGATLVGAGLHRRGEPSPVGRGVAVLAGLGLVALVLQVPVQASLASGQGWSAVTDRDVLRAAMGDGFGWSLALTGVALLGVLVTAGLPFRGPARRVALAGAAVAPLGLAVSGHTRTMSPAAIGYVADAVHLVAAAQWFGGIGALLVVLRRRLGKADLDGAAEATARFSGWAAVVLAAVVFTGGTLAWIEVGGPEPLTTTTYGRLLLAKVAVVGLVVLAAAWNRFRLLPALGVTGGGGPTAEDGEPGPDPAEGPDGGVTEGAAEADAEAEAEADAGEGDGDPGEGTAPAGRPALDDARWRRFTTIVRLEAVGLLVVLALTAVLVNVTPAKSATTGPVTASAPLGEGTVEVVVDPARPGRNDIHAYVLDAEGRPDDRYEEATFSLSLPSADLGPLEREPVNAGAGHFQLVGTDLSLGGEWVLTITVKPDRFSEESAEVTFRVR